MNQTQNQVPVLVPYICEIGIGIGTEIHASRKAKVSKIKDFINSNATVLKNNCDINKWTSITMDECLALDELQVDGRVVWNK